MSLPVNYGKWQRMTTELYSLDLSRDRILDELYSNAYVYTLPSDLEGMPSQLIGGNELR